MTTSRVDDPPALSYSLCYAHAHALVEYIVVEVLSLLECKAYSISDLSEIYVVDNSSPPTHPYPIICGSVESPPPPSYEELVICLTIHSLEQVKEVLDLLGYQ